MAEKAVRKYEVQLDKLAAFKVEGTRVAVKSHRVRVEGDTLTIET